ncbi:MAG: Helix-turn-helix domain [Acidobacteriota bacterium]|jgi:transcriptional regulator with XRE-family HTH domain|nr:Helix-turn-helix domain [Acidobacteriota bacterium]
MGSARPRPERLAEKLLRVRTALGLSQAEMLRRLGAEDQIEYHTISKYELGKNEPPLAILLRYARAVNLYVDAFIDDEVDLPARLPAGSKSEGTKTNRSSEAVKSGAKRRRAARRF